MKWLFLLVSTLFFRSMLFSQAPVEVSAVRDDKGDVQFTCINRGFSNFIIEINFTTLQNLKTDFKLPYSGVVRPGLNTLFKLKRENETQATNYGYTFRYVKGCLNPKVITDYTYLLPVAPGKETRVSEMDYFLKTYANEPAPKDWYALAINMNAGDTVFAARRGRVCEVKEDAQLKESGYAMSSNDNFLEISHDDCSFARYQVFRDREIFVKPGDFVEAGDPLGIVGGDKYVSGPHVRFCVYYNLGKDAFKDLGKEYAANHLAYIPLEFWTQDAGKRKLANNSKYTSDHPAELVTKDMNKREKKKWLDKHQ